MRYFITLLLALTLQANAFAWGVAGHHAVGAVADRLLTGQALSQVQQLLINDLDKNGNPSGRTTLESVSTWSDEIRGTAASRPAWHYDDIPCCGSVPSTPTWCPAEGCNTQSVSNLVEVLRDKTKPVRERNEAMKWLVHLVGDTHQPLHAADNGDRGGNDVQVALSGIKTKGSVNLHSAWDTALVDHSLNLKGSQQIPRALVDQLVARAQALPASSLSLDPIAWAVESNQDARQFAYNFTGFACGTSPKGIVTLSRAYIAAADKVVSERIVLGGARLAALLNDALR